MTVVSCVGRWNQLDLVIVLLSIMGITLEKIEEASLPINPTIIRIMRVLRIARGTRSGLYAHAATCSVNFRASICMMGLSRGPISQMVARNAAVEGGRGKGTLR